MAVGEGKIKNLFPVPGVSLGVTCAGIKNYDKNDLVIFELAPGNTMAGVFTKNAFCAAPVQVAKQHLASATPTRFWVINTGNANAGTGDRGYQDALDTCAKLAAVKGCPIEAVLPFSTGVIGEYLPMDRLLEGIPNVLEAMDPENWLDAAKGILTTDTRPKAITLQFEFEDETITVTGISKGAGMIKPNMATMLAFVATDAPVAQEILQEILQEANEHSFNRITVDGDTSTNDACVLTATGQARVSKCDSTKHPLFVPLKKTVAEVLLHLAQAIVKDGEGANKFVTVQVEQAANTKEALEVAYTVAHSPLVKTALTASDANWGRILAAVGRSEIDALDVNKVDIFLGDVCIVEQGGKHPAYTEEAGTAVMSEEEITIRICLNRGDIADQVYTTDLSYDYVRINAEYRT